MPELNAMRRPQAPPWFAVALIVRSTETSLDVITSCLGRSPTSTHRRGERVSERNPASPLRTENLWKLAAVNMASDSLDEIVEELLGEVNVTPTLPGDCSVELSIGLSARSMGNCVELASAAVKKLAGLGASLVLDVYNSDSATDSAEGQI